MEDSPWETNRFSVSDGFPAFYGTRWFITASSIHSILQHPISYRSILTSIYAWVSQVVFFPQVSQLNLVYASPIRTACPGHLILDFITLTIGWGVQIIQLLIVQLLPLPCYLVPRGPKYFPLKYSQSAYLPQCQRPSFTPIYDRIIVHHLPPWIRSFDLFRHRGIAFVSWGVHDLFLEVCSWGRVSGVWCSPFFKDGWSDFVCVCVSRYCIPETYRSFLMISLLILSSLVYHLTFLRKLISAASRRVKSRFVVTHVSLP